MLLAVALPWISSCSSPPPPAGGFRVPHEGRVLDLSTIPRAGTEQEAAVPGTRLHVPGAAIEQSGPGRWVTPVIVIDRTEFLGSHPGDDLAVADLERFERRHGPIPRGSLVLLRTGLAGAARRAPAEFHPGFAPAAVQYLLRMRGCVGVGADLDSLEPAPGEDGVARALEEDSAYGVTGLTGLGELPVRGAIVVVAPELEGRGGWGAARVLALAPRTGRAGAVGR